MNKNVLIGIVAFGGLILIGMSLAGTDENSEPVLEEEAIMIPSEFSSFPIYPGSELVNTLEGENESGKSVTASFDATASIAEVNEWYREALTANGWTKTSDKNVAGYQIIQGENENLFTSMQAANSGEEGQVRISQQMKIRSEI